jgi:hypothetical protein
MVVGNARRPCVLKTIMNQLPVIYSSLKNFFWLVLQSLYTGSPAISGRCSQNSLPRSKSCFASYTAPAHPNAKKLISRNKSIKCVFLPPNTTSVIQPMGQGVIVAYKLLYKKKFLEEAMVVLENENDSEEDMRSQDAAKFVRI